MTEINADWPLPIIDLELCNGCGKCVVACPAKALIMKDDKPVVANDRDCEYDGTCELICPVGAISRPFLIVSAWVPDHR